MPRQKAANTELQKELRWLQAEAFLIEIVTASKKPQKIWESPSTLTIITAEDIKAYGYQTLWDALQTVVGSIPSSDRTHSYIGTRGLLEPSLFNSRILWLIDGHTINESYFQWAFPNHSFGVDVNNIKRIEIVRGPASVPYGSSAFLGVVNVVTKDGEDIDGFYISTHIGGYTNVAGGYDDPVDKNQDALAFGGSTVTYGQQFKTGGDLLLSATYYNNPGQRLYVPFWEATGTGGVADRFDFIEAGTVLAKYNQGNVSLLGRFVSSDTGRPFGDYKSPPNHTGNKDHFRSYFVQAKHEYAWTEKIRTMARAYYDHAQFTGRWYYQGFSPLDVQTVPSDWLGAETQVSWKVGRSDLLAGLEYQNHRTSQTEDYPSFIINEETGKSYHAKDEYDFYNYAIYLQDDIKVLDNLSINLSGRYENDKDYGSIFVTRTSVAYRPRPSNLVKFQYGDAFKNPLRHDFFYLGDDGLRNDMVTRLMRERIRTVELATTQLFGKSYQVDLSLFHSKLDDLVTFEKRPEIAPEKHYSRRSAGGDLLYRDQSLFFGV